MELLQSCAKPSMWLINASSGQDNGGNSCRWSFYNFSIHSQCSKFKTQTIPPFNHRTQKRTIHRAMLWRSWHVILVYSEWKPYTRRHQSARRSDELSRPGWMVGNRFGYPEDVLIFSMMIIHIDQWTVLYHNSMYSIYAIDSNKRFLISL